MSSLAAGHRAPLAQLALLAKTVMQVPKVLQGQLGPRAKRAPQALKVQPAKTV